VIEQIKQTIEIAGDIDTPNYHLSTHEQKKALAKAENNVLAWCSYLIGEVERLSKCQSCGGTGYVEVSHDPYMAHPCECVVFDKVVQDYPKVLRRVSELQKALGEIAQGGDRDYVGNILTLTSSECRTIARQALERSETK
jgi:hypothetical protein